MTLTPLNLTDTLRHTDWHAECGPHYEEGQEIADTFPIGRGGLRAIEVFIPITRQAKDQTETYETL